MGRGKKNRGTKKKAGERNGRRKDRGGEKIKGKPMTESGHGRE